MKRVIVNADDFGLSLGTKRAIGQLLQTGAITSTTLMANGPAFEDAVNGVSSVKRHWSLGLHVNLTQFAPVGDGSGLSALLNESGQFKGRRQLAWAWLTGRISQEAIEAEIYAQFQACVEKEMVLDHLDSHQHAHAIPVVYKAMNSVGVKMGVPIRRLNPRFISGSWKRLIRIKLLNMISNRVPHSANHGLGEEISLVSIFDVQGDPSVDSYSRLLKKCPGQVIELMVHPSDIDEKHKNLTSISDVSAADYRVLSSPQWREFQNASPYQFISFTDLS